MHVVGRRDGPGHDSPSGWKARAHRLVAGSGPAWSKGKTAKQTHSAECEFRHFVGEPDAPCPDSQSPVPTTSGSTLFARPTAGQGTPEGTLWAPQQTALRRSQSPALVPVFEAGIVGPCGFGPRVCSRSAAGKAIRPGADISTLVRRVRRFSVADHNAFDNHSVIASKASDLPAGRRHMMALTIEQDRATQECAPSGSMVLTAGGRLPTGAPAPFCRQRQSDKLRGLGPSPRATAHLRKNRMSLLFLLLLVLLLRLKSEV